MKFDSTSLPQTNTPTEIQKMGNDLLDKINKTWDQIATAIAAIPAPASNFAPLPQTAAGAGQVYYQTITAGGAFTLPAGGTWWYWGMVLNIGASVFQDYSGIVAGGSSPFTATGGTSYAFGWALRIE